MEYKKDLNMKLQSMSSDRKQLTEIKKKYEKNENVKMISDALDQNNIKTKLKPKHPKYVINQKMVNRNFNNLGDFILKTEIPEAPTVSVLVRTSETVLIE